VAIAGAAAVTVLSRTSVLMTADAYLALVCGRFIAAHGLPSLDTLATVTRGQSWVDQQWLGQLVIYAMARVGGLRLLIVHEAMVTAATFAVSARFAMKRGASFLPTALAAAVGLFFCFLFLAPRPQIFSLLFFALILAIVADAPRPRELLWAIPVLVVWANVHGVVIFAAGIVGLRALVSAAQVRRDAASYLGVGMLAALSPFASPYALQLPGYFVSVWHLQDSARHLRILEWLPLDLTNGRSFFLVVVVLAALLVQRRKDTSRLETFILAFTALSAWRANRNVQFFGLAIAAYVPALVQPHFARVRLPQRLTQVCAAIALVAVLVLSVRVVRAPDLESGMPMAALPALHEVMLAQPAAGVVTSELYADWALWHEPALAGRLAFDVRYELLSDEQSRAVGTFLSARPGWQTVYPEASIALIDKRAAPSLAAQYTRLPNARVLWEDGRARLMLR